MDDYQKREAIKKVYPTDTWDKKVDKMSPAQVTAIYIRFANERKLR